jgi:hypothetical protein
MVAVGERRAGLIASLVLWGWTLRLLWILLLGFAPGLGFVIVVFILMAFSPLF